MSTKRKPPKKKPTDITTVPPQAHSDTPRGHLAALAPIPDTISNPIEWADKHLESLVPLAAKEKEWQLKFGTEATRNQVASELLAMRSISAKKDAGVNVAPVIQLVLNGPSPFAKHTGTMVDGTVVHQEKTLPAQATPAPGGESEDA